MAQSSGTPAKVGRMLGVGVAGVGGPVAAWWANPVLGQWIVGIVVGMGVIVLLTALYASETVSDRAFRLLCLIWNRPEPARRRSRKRRSTGA